MARPKESNEQKVKKVYPHARLAHIGVDIDIDTKNVSVVDFATNNILSGSHHIYASDAAWSDALKQIRKAKIKAAKPNKIRNKKTDEDKVKFYSPDAFSVAWNNTFGIQYFYISNDGLKISGDFLVADLAWSDALKKIRYPKIKAAKDKRKQAQLVKVKEIKKHVSLTMYDSNKDIIVKGFGSVQKFLDSKVNEYKLTIKTN